mgnify:CR=1 FL=1
MNFNSIWKSYLNEEKELELLVEARVKDIKKKYPVLTDTGWLAYSREKLDSVLGPKGVSKYLLFCMRELHRGFKQDIEDSESWIDSEHYDVQDVKTVADEILEAVLAFQENQQRIEEKDIYKYNIGELQRALSKLGLSSSQKKEKEKAEAMKTTEIVYDENGIFAVRPYSEASSCYFGKNTRWCISATQSRNYFNQYTGEGKAFVMVRFDGIPADNSMHKLALVYDRDGELEEVFDAPDNDHSDYIVFQAAALHFGEEDYELIDDEDKKEKIDDIASDIIQNGFVNVLDNPPDPSDSYEAECRQVEEDLEDDIKHADYGFEVDNYGDGAYVSFWASFNIELDNEIFENGKYQFDDGYHTAGEIINKMSEAQIYFEDLDITDHSGKTTFQFRMAAENYEANPEGYRQLLEEVAFQEKRKFSAMRRILLKYLADEEFIPPAAFDNFRARLDDIRKSLNHFKVMDADYVGEEEIVFDATPIDTDVEYSYLRFICEEKLGGKWVNPELTKGLTDGLQNLNKAVQTYLAQQLELPIDDLPPRVVQDLSIPDSLEMYLYRNLEKAQIIIRMTLDNPEADDKELELGLNVVKFIDSNYDLVVEAARNALSSVVRKALQSQKNVEDGFPKPAKRLIAMAKQSGDSDLARLLRRIPDYTRSAYKLSQSWSNSTRGPGVPPEEYVYNLVRSQVLRPIYYALYVMTDSEGKAYIPVDDREAGFEKYAPAWGGVQSSLALESTGVQSEIDNYLNNITEEKGRSRQRGIYKFYCMIGYRIESGQKQRGLDDILGDIRAITGVTVVTVVVSNRKVAEDRYISGLAIKFIPSTPGSISSPEDAKSRILKTIKAINNVDRIFKVSTSFERIE